MTTCHRQTQGKWSLEKHPCPRSEMSPTVGPKMGQFRKCKGSPPTTPGAKLGATSNCVIFILRAGIKLGSLPEMFTCSSSPWLTVFLWYWGLWNNKGTGLRINRDQRVTNSLENLALLQWTYHSHVAQFMSAPNSILEKIPRENHIGPAPLRVWRHCCENRTGRRGNWRTHQFHKHK